MRTVHPGRTFDDTLTATNLTGAPVPVVLGAVDASVTPDGQFAPAAEGVDAKAGGWITVPQRKITLPAHGSVAVPVRFRVPADAVDGDHLAAVTIEKRAPDEVRNDIAVRVRVAVRVYLTVTGAGRAPASAFAIRQLDFTGSAAAPRLAVTVVATGRRLVEPLGAVRLQRGALSSTVTLPVLGAVPAGESRTFTIPLRDALEPGRYLADLDLWLPDGSVKASAHTQFGIAVAAGQSWGPWEVSLVALILLLLLVLLGLVHRRGLRPCTGRGAHRARPTRVR